MSVLVTGGTGFIGRKLVQRLLEQGEAVRLFSRAQSDMSGLAQSGVMIARGELSDKESLRRAMDGCRRVFHLAGYARNWAPSPAVYFEINVQGFRNVAEVALERGVERLVFTSTSVTLGPSNGGVVNEQTRRSADFFTEYERSKRLGEIEGDRLLQRGLPLVTVNPTRVYGPGKMTEGNSVTKMIEMYLNGRFPFLLGNGRQVGNYVHVDDLVAGHLLAMERGRIGEKYILGGENCSLAEFFGVLSRLSGRKPPRFHLPPALAMAFVHMEALKAKVLRRYPLITPGWLRTFLADWAFSSDKARAELGYRWRGIEAGLRETCEWLMAQDRGRN